MHAHGLNRTEATQIAQRSDTFGTKIQEFVLLDECVVCRNLGATDATLCGVDEFRNLHINKVKRDGLANA